MIFFQCKVISSEPKVTNNLEFQSDKQSWNVTHGCIYHHWIRRWKPFWTMCKLLFCLLLSKLPCFFTNFYAKYHLNGESSLAPNWHLFSILMRLQFSSNDMVLILKQKKYNFLFIQILFPFRWWRWKMTFNRLSRVSNNSDWRVASSPNWRS